ncbi:hypothetical protein [Actinoplanes philippinensis]|uniref:hypothetical protein n=1 Tax=Actinoplanes philippinensis TaxID=35752 RepID=UPI0034095ACF
MPRPRRHGRAPECPDGSRRDDLVATRDRLRPPAELTPGEDGTVLRFRRENQSVTHRGVPLDRITEPDPPVVLAGPDGSGWVSPAYVETRAAAGRLVLAG